ncbi:MAG: GTP cyclohydrolase II, partial [Acidimicrobiia bacterium]
GVLCEVVNDDGTMCRGEQLHEFASIHDIPLITIEALVAHRWRTEAILSRVVESTIPTAFGEFRIFGFRSAHDGSEQVALVLGDVAGRQGVLTRVHSECLTGDAFGSLRCDCHGQLHASMDAIAAAGEGVIVYTRGHEGRGIGLLGKLEAYRLQDQGLDTVEANVQLGYAADDRHYGVAGQILNDLKVSSVRLLTNNPDKVRQLRALGVDVAERVPHVVATSDAAAAYLATKISKLGHLTPQDER